MTRNILCSVSGSGPHSLPSSCISFRRRIWTGFLGCGPCHLSAMKVTASKTRSGTCRRSWSPPWVWWGSYLGSWQSWRSRSVSFSELRWGGGGTGATLPLWARGPRNSRKGIPQLCCAAVASGGFSASRDSPTSCAAFSLERQGGAHVALGDGSYFLPGFGFPSLLERQTFTKSCHSKVPINPFITRCPQQP